jgi:hypothetical protein
MAPTDEEIHNAMQGNQQLKKGGLKGMVSKNKELNRDKKYSAYMHQPDEPRTLTQAIEEKPKIQFVTSNQFPEEVSMWFGATVSARSVRLISLKTTERESWWAELRQEITKNAMSLNCTHIIGYREIVSIF